MEVAVVVVIMTVAVATGWCRRRASEKLAGWLEVSCRRFSISLAPSRSARRCTLRDRGHHHNHNHHNTTPHDLTRHHDTECITHLDSSLPTRQASGLCAPLDLLLVAAARHGARVHGGLRWEGISHHGAVRLLAGRRHGHRSSIGVGLVWRWRIRRRRGHGVAIGGGGVRMLLLRRRRMLRLHAIMVLGRGRT